MVSTCVPRCTVMSVGNSIHHGSTAAAIHTPHIIAYCAHLVSVAAAFFCCVSTSYCGRRLSRDGGAPPQAARRTCKWPAGVSIGRRWTKIHLLADVCTAFVVVFIVVVTCYPAIALSTCPFPSPHPIPTSCAALLGWT